MKRLILLAGLLAVFFQIPAASQAAFVLQVAADQTSGYDRSLFKHWIDEDKDGCDTRAEVLIQEALKKPKIGKRCSLKGGSWRSAYDNRTLRNSSQLDVDHVVPLAEAWRSGAWNWTPERREAFANDLDAQEALIAVSASSNRSKGDSDVAEWLPAFDKCSYVSNWITVKAKYGLAVDTREAVVLLEYIASCSISGVSISNEPSQVQPLVSPTPSASPTASSTQGSSEATLPKVTAGAFCAKDQEGKQGLNDKGVVYTCKTSSTENRLRWRLGS